MRFLTLTIFGLLPGCQLSGTSASGRPALPRFEVKVHKPKNGHDLPRENRTTLAGDAVIFDVTDRFGIGSGTVRLVEGAGPAKVLVRYHLGGLQGGSATVAGNPPSLPTPPVMAAPTDLAC